jgi:hypothetical protein
MAGARAVSRIVGQLNLSDDVFIVFLYPAVPCEFIFE